MPFLVNIKNQKFRLNTGMNIIGRLKNGNVQIKDSTISRKHLSIDVLGDETFTLMDLGSSNGLYVKGEKVPNAILKNGDIFSIDECREYVSHRTTKFK